MFYKVTVGKKEKRWRLTFAECLQAEIRGFPPAQTHQGTSVASAEDRSTCLAAWLHEMSPRGRPTLAAMAQMGTLPRQPTSSAHARHRSPLQKVAPLFSTPLPTSPDGSLSRAAGVGTAAGPAYLLTARRREVANTGEMPSSHGGEHYCPGGSVRSAPAALPARQPLRTAMTAAAGLCRRCGLAG